MWVFIVLLGNGHVGIRAQETIRPESHALSNLENYQTGEPCFVESINFGEWDDGRKEQEKCSGRETQGHAQQSLGFRGTEELTQ